MTTLSLLTRLSVIASCALPGAHLAGAQAADDASDISIEHWGNALLITAPTVSEDAHVLHRLQGRITVDFQDTPFSDVATFLRQAGGVNVVLDPELSAADPHVTLKAVDMSLDNVVHWLTKLTSCHVAATNGVLYFSLKPLVGSAKTVLYDVSDLTMTVRDFPGPELAMNAGSGKGAALLAAVEPAQPPPSIDDLEDFLRKSLGAAHQ